MLIRFHRRQFIASTGRRMSNISGSCEDGVCVPSKSEPKEQHGGQQRLAPVRSTAAAARGNDSQKTLVKIDIISDTMCPWCWVGKRNLEAALNESPDIATDVTWLPYFLDRTLPEAGKPVLDYYRDNYGDPGAGQRMKQTLVRAGRTTGIDFETHYVHMDRYRPTVRSHRLIEYAKEQGRQDEMVEELFRIYYEQGKHLNSIDDLCGAAAAVGLAGDVAAFLASNEKEQAVYETAAKVAPLARGVPTFIFSRPDRPDIQPLSFSGGQPPEAFRRVFDSLSTNSV
jgi:predicted DsbA family dithiol-disulfide isomerase